MLAAAAVGLAIIVAGVGGWRVGVVTAPTGAAGGPLSAATLLSATHQNVGRVFVYSGTRGGCTCPSTWALATGAVTCQVIGENGQVTTVGSFRLADGFGAWGSPNPGYLGELSGARLVAPNGAVLAAGTFSAS